jgi:anti-anti-sigma factor
VDSVFALCNSSAAGNMPARPISMYNPAMHVDVRQRDDVIIVDLQGRLVAGVGDELLRAVTNELLAEGWQKILLNLDQVTIIDSSGIGELVSSWKISSRFGASFRILRPGDQVARSLQLSQIMPLLEVYEDEEAAIDALREWVPPPTPEADE